MNQPHQYFSISFMVALRAWPETIVSLIPIQFISNSRKNLNYSFNR